MHTRNNAVKSKTKNRCEVVIALSEKLNQEDNRNKKTKE
jgi:hypothetical protein